MSDVAIRVQGLSKRYRIGKRERYRTIRESLVGAVAAPFRRLARRPPDDAAADAGTDAFWALKDVDFEVKRGEVVGIIGRNGAGKSTLLKILSRITEPTAGTIDIYGRVGSLLEVGTGFHPELTGRENIYLNGAILGMKRGEIDRKFDEIVAFSEVEKFLDTPVKHFSSGMYTRLAFAVAAHLEPEILVVDEVLAVGDAEFQKKCLGKMNEVASSGRTVMFVSHDLSAIREICPRTVWLQSGGVHETGPSSSIIDRYLSSVSARDTKAIVSNERCSILSVNVRNVRSSDATASQIVDTAVPWQVKVEYELRGTLATGASIRVMNDRGIILFDRHEFMGRAPARPAGTFETTFEMEPLPLAPGSYSISAYLMVHQGETFLIADSFGQFTVLSPLVSGDGAIRTFDVQGVLLLGGAITTSSTAAASHVAALG